MPRPVALLLVLPGLKHAALLQDTERQCHTLFNISLALTAAGLARPETSCGTTTGHNEQQRHTLFNITGTVAGPARPETSCGTTTGHGERQSHTLFNITLTPLLVLSGLKHHVALLQDTVNDKVTPFSISLWH